MKTDPKPALVLLQSVIEDRAADIRQITSTENSFESWLQWEWWLRCKTARGLTVRFEPLYREHTAQVGGNLRADLMLRSSLEAAPVLVELAVVHPGNADSWLCGGKLDADRERLAAMASSEAFGLQVVVVASAKACIESHPWWLARLSAWKGWGRPESWNCAVPLDPGEVIVRAWW